MKDDKQGPAPNSPDQRRQYDRQGPTSYPPDQPGGIFNASSRRFFDDEMLGDDPDRTIIRRRSPTDVSSLPTMKMPTVSRLIQTAQPVTYEELDERLEDDLDFGRMSTVDLMQLSGVMEAVTIQQPGGTVRSGRGGTGAMARVDPDVLSALTASLPETPQPGVSAKASPLKAALGSPVVKVAIGLVLGILIIVLMARFANIPKAIETLQARITTPESTLNAVMHAAFAGAAFLGAFAIRGVRWRMFLSRIGKVSTFKIVRLFWIATFVNFLLPVQGGEVAKSLMLKRITGIPISQSLPTVAMDKALDLMPALIIMALVPFLPGIQMSTTLWVLLGCVGSVLIGLILIVALTAWKRSAAIALIHMFVKILPKGVGQKIEGFAMGFVDSLLAGASNPKIFIPAVLLTCLAVICDGLFAMQGFAAIGLAMPFGSAIFGYMVYNMFSILPSPPGQVGTSEFAGLTAFHFLLGFNEQDVLAMFIASHPLCATIMGSAAWISAQTLGLKLFSVVSSRSDKAGRTDPHKQAVRV
jgi:uncharacterized protein (TIRG00374 family)